MCLALVMILTPTLSLVDISVTVMKNQDRIGNHNPKIGKQTQTLKRTN
jgi:hypothetical protein